MTWEEEELVGLWSAGEGYYATFSEEWLIFKPDGTGRLVFLNPYYESSHYFRWQVVSQGVLDLIGYSPHDLESEAKANPVGNIRFHFPGVHYSVSESERPPGTGNWMLVLRLDLEMPWPNDLGFVTKDYAESEASLKKN